ncbi:MAG: VCBS repeat-containing protein, partial [Candidatus Poribacteria bacterium]|nr:VCBS repeat-containing protein [Candidatus Poribacteria bacterium]
MMPASTEFTFEQYEVATGAGKHQTVLTGFMLGGDLAELAIVNIDKNNDRYLRIYAFSNNTWAPKIDITLRPEVLFVDVINIGGVDRLIMYEHGRLNWLDPESTIEHSLVTVPSMIVPPDGNIPHVDITRDVNGDARDDLVMPDSDGFWVFIQTTDGVFADPMKLGPFTKKDRIYEVDGYQHTPWNQSRIHEMDYNRDGRNDLVFWNVDHFKVHSQDEHGLFAPVATTFTTDIVFDSDDLASLAAPYGVRRRRRDHQPT